MKSPGLDSSFAPAGLLEAFGRSDCTDDAHNLVSPQCATGEAASVMCTLPDEELFVSVRASLRTRGYKELEMAFKHGCRDAWRYLPWFREMLLDSDEAAFMAACAAVAASCRSLDAGDPAMPAQPTWLAALAEGLVRHGSREGVVTAGADLIAVALQHHGTKVWSFIAGLLQKPQPSAGALRLLQVCAGQGVCCAEEVWPMIREVALAALGPFSFVTGSVGDDGPAKLAHEELVALLQLLPSIDAKLSAELGIHILQQRNHALEACNESLERDAGLPIKVAWDEPAKEQGKHGKSTALESRASPAKSTPARLQRSGHQHSPKPAETSPPPGTPLRASSQRGGWQWDDRLAASPVPPEVSPADCDALHTLGTASPRSWRKRLQCLQELDGADSEGLHGVAVLPQLVLQAEDGHPAIAAAALQAIARVARHLEGGHVGDFLAERLAIAIRGRLRGGRARRYLEASAACLAALVRHSAIASGRVDSFLMQALGCAREAARAVVAAFHEEGLSTPRGRGGALRVPSILEELLHAAVSPRRVARRSSAGTPCRPNSRPTSRPCTPQQRSPSTRMVAGPTATSPWRPSSMLDRSPSTPTLCREQLQEPVLQLPLFMQNAEEDAPGSWSAGCGAAQTRLSPSLRTPPRYARPAEERDSPLQALHSGTCTPSSHGLLLAREVAAASNDRSCAPRSVPRDGATNAPLPRSRQLAASASAPLLRAPGPWQPRDSNREIGGPPSMPMPGRGASGNPALQEQSTTSLAGPRLYADSQLLSPSCASLELPSFPTAAGTSAVPCGIASPRSTLRPDATPLQGRGSGGARRDAEGCTSHTAGQRLDSTSSTAGELTMTSPVPWLSPIDEPGSASPREKSFLVSPPSTSNVRVRGLCNAAAAGLHALETGGDPAAWHSALRALAAWEPGADGVRGEAAAEAVVELLLDAAPRLRGESLPEIWRALGELRAAPWLSEVAVLELAVGHCLSFTAPAVVAAFLVARVSEGRLTATACLESCLERLLESNASKRVDSPRLAGLLSALMESLDTDDLRDLLLPSLPAVVEWASPRRLSMHVSLRTALEALLRHISPACMSEQCWEKLLDNLRQAELPASAADGPTQAITTTSNASPLVHSPAVNVSLSAKLACAATPCEAPGDGRARFAANADQGDAGELAAMCSRMHRLTGELGRVKGPEVADVLQMATQLLSKPQIIAPLRAFLRRLLARQRSRAASKENVPPPFHAAPNGAFAIANKQGAAATEIFLDNDFASVRELASDEGLAGSFPHSLLVPLKRLLGAPAAAGTHRAALECLAAMLTACGLPLLRVLLRHFAGSILHLAAVRGPAQARARALLSQLLLLNDRWPTGGCSRSRLLRMVWRALAQAAQPGSSAAEAGEHTGSLAELLRWLGEDALAALGGRLESTEARELLLVLAPALRDRNSAVRSAATRTLHVLAQARGGAEQLREDVEEISQMATSLRAALLSCLECGPPPVPAMVRTPSTAARTSWASDPSSPNPSSANTAGSNSGNSSCRGIGSTSRPRRLRFTPKVERSPARRADSAPSPALAFSHTPSPQPRPSLEVVEVAEYQALDLSAVKHTPPQEASFEACSKMLSASSSIQELEQELHAWHAELAHGLAMEGSAASGSVWLERAGLLHARLERASLHHGCVESGTLIPATLNLCKQLVHAGAASSGCDLKSVDVQIEPSDNTSALLLEAALAVARAANATFSSLAVSQLCSTAAVTSFRAVLQALARLQQFSKSGLPWAQRAAAPLLLELPPVLACIIDKMEGPVQLVAWMRVAAEVLEEEVASRGLGASGSAVATAARRWALRFCTRCVDRCTAQMPQGTEGFPAWDVLSEVLRFHERRHLLEGPVAAAGANLGVDSAERSLLDGTWQVDCEAWGRALESTARLVATQYPAQAREFLLLAACTGSSMPQTFERLLEEA